MEKTLEELFKNNLDALFFINHYCSYCHLVDDIQDNESTTETLRIIGNLATIVYNCNYWRKYSQTLLLVDVLIQNTYFDSVKWEKSSGESTILSWKQRDARVMSRCGYNMIFAVIYLEFGSEKLNELSLQFREETHLKQGHDKL